MSARGQVALALLLALAPGCYLSHERSPDAGPELDAGPSDAGPDDAAVIDAGPPGCHAECQPPRLVAHVALPSRRDEPPPGAFADAVAVGDTLVVLTARSHIGHAGPVYRVLFFTPSTGTVRASEAWTGPGAFPQHVDGARIVSTSDGRVGVLALVGRPHLSGPLPTGRQAVTVHHVEWTLDGALAGARSVSSFPDDDTLGCPGGCRAGIAVAGDRAVVSYAPAGELWRTEISLPDLRASTWVAERPVDDPDPAPWPHESVFWEGERWIAGGGTPDLEAPRRGWLLGPSEVEPLAGTSDDLPPLLMGGRSLVLARHVSGASPRFGVQRLRPGEPLEALSVATGVVGPLASWLARAPGDRTVLAWTSLAPGSLRDTVLRVVPDVPFGACEDEVVPAEVARIPEGIASPAVLAHALGDALYVMAIAGEPGGGSARSLAVFELRECAMVDR